MTDKPKIGVMGAGSVGCYVGGKLLAAESAEVILLGRSRLQDELATHGLCARDIGDKGTIIPPDKINYQTDPTTLHDCDIVLFCVKSAQTAEVAQQLADILQPGTVVASLQNGLSNPTTLREHMPNAHVLAGIVSFNVVSQGEGIFQRGTSGPIMLQASDKPAAKALVTALKAAGIPIKERADLRADQWTKLLINLNNSISALSGAPTLELLMTPKYRKILGALLDESLAVLKTANIPIARLRGVPVWLLPKMMRQPDWLFKLLLGAQLKIDPDARSSMWEDLQRGRKTEIDYLNGEIVKLAKEHNTSAPLNERITELVRTAEEAKNGSPNIVADALWDALGLP